MLIGLMGQGRSGKDTVGQFFVKKYEFTRHGIADEIKRVTLQLFPNPSRELYQKVGSLMREVNQNIWLDFIFKNICLNRKTDIVITDVRYKHEMEYIQDRGGLVMRLVRKGNLRMGFTESEKQHPSEIEQLAIPDDCCDTIEAESGDIVGLCKRAEECYLDWKKIKMSETTVLPIIRPETYAALAMFQTPKPGMTAQESADAAGKAVLQEEFERITAEIASPGGSHYLRVWIEHDVLWGEVSVPYMETLLEKFRKEHPLDKL